LKTKVLFGVLNWGLGHAGRSIPVIQELIDNDFDVFIASDGEAYQLLQSEFPELKYYQLQGYNIRYPFKSIFLNVFRYAFSILWAIYSENRQTKNLIKQIVPDFIISDNRYGFRNRSVTSIFITHQTTIHHKNGLIKTLANLLNRYLLKKFDRIWIPDFPGEMSVAGKLSKVGFKIPCNYIGILSRLQTIKSTQVYDAGIILSGPEPQRTIFENLLNDQLKNISLKILLIRGVFTGHKDELKASSLRIMDHAFSGELNKLLNECDIIISRSGYSTIMDIIKLGKKAAFIPTPGQTEQEYLAEFLYQKGFYPYFDQNEFDLKKAIMEAKNFPGIKSFDKDYLKNAVMQLKDL